MYLAEFAVAGTTELANELLINAASEDKAKIYAQEYASHWEVELFSLMPITEKQVRSFHLLGRSLTVNMLTD
jgi:hypothetical protein